MPSISVGIKGFGESGDVLVGFVGSEVRASQTVVRGNGACFVDAPVEINVKFEELCKNVERRRILFYLISFDVWYLLFFRLSLRICCQPQRKQQRNGGEVSF